MRGRSIASILTEVIIVGIYSVSAVAQVNLELQWFRANSGFWPVPLPGAAMAFDNVRGEVVLFGGGDWSNVSNETWVWDGARWTARFPETRPPARRGHAMVFDSARSVIVLFGGSDQNNQALDDTWVWNGSNWLQQTPSTRPPARSHAAMAYDSIRQEVVLFGGSNGDTMTWIWNGSNWSPRFPNNSPPWRVYHAMAFDSARGEVVLFGGATNTAQNDTWVWNGQNWTQKLPSFSPPARYYHAMAFDSARGQVVLFGGYANGNALNDTWVWNGTSWGMMIPLTQIPQQRYMHAMAFDQAGGEIVMFGGYSSDVYTWVWNGADWQAKPQTPPTMAAANDPVRAELVAVLGSSDSGAPVETWIWNGVQWRRRQPVNSPPGRGFHAVAFDEARQELVLFGGRSSTGELDDTWTWNGENWLLRSTTLSPPARSGHAMVYDANRRKLVLFGGKSGSAALGDTWEWDGTAWVQRSPALSPPPRHGHAMAYDPVRSRVVLFGGSTGTSLLNDTWEWDGDNWIFRPTSQAPAARSGHAMTFDAMRGVVVLHGGALASDTSNDLWKWDGAAWSQDYIYGSGTPAKRSGHIFTYDAARAQLVLAGGPITQLNQAYLLGRRPVGPSPRLISPGSGEGHIQQFTIVVDPGSESLQVVNVLWNFWLDGRQACYVAYLPASRSLYLVDDAGNAAGPFQGGLVLGIDSTSISNSQCTIHGASSWASNTPDGALQLHLRVEFAPSFAGTRIAYAAARSSTQNSGWRRLGVWTVPGSEAIPGYPRVSRLSPSEGSGKGPETLEVEVADADGPGDVKVVNILLNDWLDGRQACYVAYVPEWNAVVLVDDQGNAGGPFAGSFVLGSSMTIGNSQCTIHGDGTTVLATPEGLKLRLKLSYKPTFSGYRVAYVAVRDQADRNSGWLAIGRRILP